MRYLKALLTLLVVTAIVAAGVGVAAFVASNAFVSLLN